MNFVNKFFGNMLHKACSRNKLWICKILISIGFDINRKDKNGNTPLYCAMLNLNFEIVKYLLEFSTKNHFVLDTNITNNKGNCAVDLAIIIGDLKIVKSIIDYNELKFGEKSYIKNHPELLSKAAIEWKVEITEYFINEGIDVQYKYNNETILHILLATSYPNIEIIKMLIDAGVDVNAVNQDGQTALHLYAKDKHEVEYAIEIVRLLSANGAKLDLKDNFGKTPLFYMIYCHHKDVIDLMLWKGCNVNEQDNEGNTILHIAARGRSRHTIDILFGGSPGSPGPDLRIKNNEGKTAYQVARESFRSEYTLMMLRSFPFI